MEVRRCPSEFDPRIPSSQAQFATIFMYLDQPFGIVANLADSPTAFDPSIVYLKVRLSDEEILFEGGTVPIHEQIQALLDLHPILKEIKLSQLALGSFIALRWSAMNPTPYHQIIDFYTYHSLDIQLQDGQDPLSECAAAYLSKGFVNIPNPYQAAFEASFILMHQVRHPFQHHTQFDNVCRLFQIPLCDIRSIRLGEYAHQSSDARYMRYFYNNPSSQLYINALYCKHLRNTIMQYYSERQASRSNHTQRLLFCFPFVNCQRNDQIKDFYFLDLLTDNDQRTAIRELQSRVLTQLQILAPRNYAICELFEQDDEIYKTLCDVKFSIFSPLSLENRAAPAQDETFDLQKSDAKHALGRADQFMDNLVILMLKNRPERRSNQFGRRESDIFPIVNDVRNNFADYGLTRHECEQLFVNTRYSRNVHEIAKSALNGQFRGWKVLPRIGWFQAGFEGEREAIKQRLGHLWGVEQDIVVKTVGSAKKKWELS